MAARLDIQAAVQADLQGTPYAVTSLTPLAGGTANFIFKASLRTPLQDGTREVLVKNSQAYAAGYPALALPLLRCEIEVQSLRILADLPPVISSNYEIRTPLLLHYHAETHTQIQEHLGRATSLKEYALKHYAAVPTPSALEPQCHRLGVALGTWLRAFHAWSDHPGRRALRDALARNRDMRRLKRVVNYDHLAQRAQRYPRVLGGCEPVLRQIADMAAAELEDESKLHVIHGDFWTGNVLLPDLVPEASQRVPVPVRIVDWEMAQVGVRAEDLGQLVAELWELKLYKDADAGLWMIQGFAQGYGQVDAELGFRALLHVGAHLVCFGSSTPGWGTEEQGQDVAAVGRDVLLDAWGKKAEGFRNHPLGCLLGL